jgi:hypothetical protein
MEKKLKGTFFPLKELKKKKIKGKINNKLNFLKI